MVYTQVIINGKHNFVGIFQIGHVVVAQLTVRFKEDVLFSES